MRLPVVWVKEAQEVDFRISEKFLEGMRRDAKRLETDADFGGASICMANVEAAINMMFENYYVPDTAVGAFPVISTIQRLYEPQLIVKSISCDDKLYNSLWFSIPMYFEMAMIPHRLVAPGELFIFARNKLSRDPSWYRVFHGVNFAAGG